MTPKRILVIGATGTIGHATVAALLAEGHNVVCIVRSRWRHWQPAKGVEVRVAQVTDRASFARNAIRGETFDVLVSCLASRTGGASDAWAIDYQATVDAVAEAKIAGVRHVVLLSAICVQRPRLVFQHAKLAAEKALIASGLTYSIVRPTAYFKSLSGQVGRVRRGKPYLLFGDGRLTRTKPISDADLARYIARCLSDPSLHDRILPIGGPGPAITPIEQAEVLFRLAGRTPRFRRVPIGFIDAIAAGMGVLGRMVPKFTAKAELARIGRYYATESMLVYDSSRRAYDEAATPETGHETLPDFYARALRGDAEIERGDHAVF